MKFIDLRAQYKQIEDAVGKRIKTVLEHGQFILGPEVADLETNLAEFVGVKHCLGVSSGTDALLIALLALGVKPGDEVITTPFTFIATGETIALLGAKPVFVDIDVKTYNINPDLVEKVITSKTKAIMPVSLYGQCCDFDSINEIAARYNLPVIEDGAQSFGATYRGRKSCSLSTIGCTSFFPSKPLGGYGDGGACFTNDCDLAKKMRQISVHGQSRRYHHPLIGINGRLDTLQAAVLLEKLKIFPYEIEQRNRIGELYTKMLSDSRIVTPFITPQNTSVYAQYTIQVENRNRLQEKLSIINIPSAVHYPVPLHKQPALAQDSCDLAVSEMVSQKVISLPMHPYLNGDEQKRVAEAVLDSI